MARQFSGENMRAQREAAGLRVEHLALAIQRGTHTVLRYEWGHGVPPTPILALLADAIGCTTDAFFADDELAATA